MFVPCGSVHFLCCETTLFYFTDVKTEFRKFSHLARFPSSSGAGFEYRSATVSRAKNSDRPTSEGLPGEVVSLCPLLQGCTRGSLSEASRLSVPMQVPAKATLARTCI
ncbi:unnamed protein product [Rangifer tarandus platyrhynchus]|uniref:Uncharacterized protein n=1 Tax=Rangifer tarandus platyrhynchus TaxID=3082113 RepID=A0AC59ZAL5_RANTA